MWIHSCTRHCGNQLLNIDGFTATTALETLLTTEAMHAKHAESENYVVGPPDSHDVGTFAFCGDGGDQMGFVDELQASCDGLDVAAASRLREALAKAIDLLTRANEDDFESGLDSPES